MITGLDQLKEGSESNVVIMEQIEDTNEQHAESKDDSLCLQEVR